MVYFLRPFLLIFIDVVRLRIGHVALMAVACAVVFFACAFFLSAPEVYAQLNNPNTETVATAAGISTTPLPIIIARIIRVILGILGIVLVILIIYAGVLYMSSGGDPTKTEKAIKVIRNAIIGLVIVMSSYGIASFILGRLSGAVRGTIAGGGAGGFTEPFSAALGTGIIQSHYPPRGAVNIPRNTRIMITFKEAMDPAGVILGFDDNPASTDLNTGNILVYETEAGDEAALEAADFIVTHTLDNKTFVLDPVPLLGNAQSDTNYTVELASEMRLQNGEVAFTGVARNGYRWAFEVSTEVDLTPPIVTSVVPAARTSPPYARNLAVEITFSEAMDPVAASGVYRPAENLLYGHIEVLASGATTTDQNVDGTFTLTNQYRTVVYTSDDACAQDPCGNTIFCLPASSFIEIEAHAATVGADAPQAVLFDASFDGLVDAAGNSLDGSGNGEALGSPQDDYTWGFNTSAEMDTRIPVIETIEPNLLEGNVPLDAPVLVTFSMEMLTSTLVNDFMQLLPDHVQELWFTVETQPGPDLEPVTEIQHAPLWPSTATASYNYYPVVSNGVRGINQMCMYPADGPTFSLGGPSATGSCATSAAPYCCDGIPSETTCVRASGTPIPNL